jgi:hypothetical protein
MTHAMSRLQALAHEALTVDQARFRPLRDDGGDQHITDAYLRPIHPGTGARRGASSGVVPQTQRVDGRWRSRATSGGLTVMGLGETIEESLDNFWRSWEAA